MDAPDLLMHKIREDQQKRQEDLKAIRENKILLSKLEKNLYTTFEQLQEKLAVALEENKRLSTDIEKISAERYGLLSQIQDGEEHCKLVEAELRSLKENQERNKQSTDKDINDMKEKYATLLSENMRYKVMEDDYRLLKEEFRVVKAKNKVYEKRFYDGKCQNEALETEIVETKEGIQASLAFDSIRPEQYYENLNNQLQVLNDQMESCIRDWQKSFLEERDSKDKNERDAKVTNVQQQ